VDLFSIALAKFFRTSAETPPIWFSRIDVQSSFDFSNMLRNDRLLMPPSRIRTSTCGR
jgi:hypothetical protein